MIGQNAVKDFKNQTDAEIILRILGGEITLYEVIIRRQNPYLYKIGRAYGFNHEDTEDLMQETYLSVFRNLNNFENRAAFKTWITKVMLNHCYQKKKKFGFQNEIPTEFKPHENLQPMFLNKTQNADQVMLGKELNQIVEKALNRIPTGYRMVFSLRELNGMTVDETSEVLGISENNVKVRLNRARKMLRTEIEKLYSPMDIFEFNLKYCDKMVERVLSKILSVG